MKVRALIVRTFTKYILNGWVNLIKENAAIENKRNKGQTLKIALSYKYMYVLLLPGILYFIIFRYLPMGGLVIAFKEYSIFTSVWAAPWTGLKNFQDVFASVDFWNVLRNTLLISAYKIIVGFPVPIALALLLNEMRSKYFKKSIQTVLYLPHFISWVVIGGIMLSIFSPSYGIVGEIFKLFGQEPINLMGSTKYFRGLLVASEVWKEAGWGTIIYLASLSVVDPNLYEAAIVDGANRWQQIWHITLPCISGVIVLMLILRIGNLMDAGFEQILVLQNDLVIDISDIFDTYVYRVGLRQGNYSFTTAVGLFNSVIAMILIYSSDRFAKLIGEEGLF